MDKHLEIKLEALRHFAWVFWTGLADKSLSMDNRRQNYRHIFSADRPLPVALQRGTGGPLWHGWALDLSVTGTRVRLEKGPQRLTSGDRVLLRLELPGAREPLQVLGRIIHCHSDVDGDRYGVEFPPSLSPRMDERRERLIWQFLMNEQRREIKRHHEKAK